ILMALKVREQTGRGQRVETSLLRAAFALQSGTVLQYPSKPSIIRDNPTYRLYQAGDGQWFFLAVGNQAFWVKLCTALDMEPLADDPRFASWLLRLENNQALLPLMEATFKSKPRSHWLEVLAAHDIPAAPVQTVAQFMADPAVRHHDMVREYDHPDVGRLTMMGEPLVFYETPARDAGPPPALGQHTDAVLEELGYTDVGIAELKRRGVVKGSAT
ncbi:MAG: CaiB/BaiF CoA-transferase family protein, partial [candidate division NC10 bacterium]